MTLGVQVEIPPETLLQHLRFHTVGRAKSQQLWASFGKVLSLVWQNFVSHRGCGSKPNRSWKTLYLWRCLPGVDITGRNVRHVDLDQSQMSSSAGHPFVVCGAKRSYCRKQKSGRELPDVSDMDACQTVSALHDVALQILRFQAFRAAKFGDWVERAGSRGRGHG
jgi:hypothetical protein